MLHISMTRENLTKLLFSNQPFFTVLGKTYLLKKVERESGEGRSFNIHAVDMNNSPACFFVKFRDKVKRNASPRKSL